MASEKRAAANRANAARSTGPRTKRGKDAAKMNAVAHGLRSAAPVVPGEREEDFDAFRAAVVAALAPGDAAETVQADRVARLYWRVQRVERYEVAATVAAQDAAGSAAREFFAPGPYRRTPAVVRADLEQARREGERQAAELDRYRRLVSAPDGAAFDGPTACRVLAEVGSCLSVSCGGDGGGDGFAELRAIRARCQAYWTAAGVPGAFIERSDCWDGWTAAAVRAGVAEIARAGGPDSSKQSWSPPRPPPRGRPRRRTGPRRPRGPQSCCPRSPC